MSHSPTLEMHQAAVDAGLQSIFPQYHNRLRAFQYALPHAVTLRHIHEGMHVLDWGCGNGHFSWFLLRHGVRVTGYSFGNIPDLLRQDASFTHVRGSQDSPVALPFEDGTFDAVFSIGVLEHVHDCGGSQPGSMREFSRVLRPGGLFHCFHLPSDMSWVEHLGRLLKRTVAPKLHAHTRLFGEKDIRRLCDETRFELLDLGRYNVLPRNQLANLLPSLTMRPNFVASFNALDSALTGILPCFAQQWHFTARKDAA